MRTQFPEHTIGFVDHFKSIQLKFIASYHGVYDQRDLDFRREKLLQVYKRAALPIDVGGMSLRNIDNVNLVAYPCSFVASIKEIAKVFPHWISLNECGDVSAFNSLCSQRTHDLLTSLVEKFNALVPDSIFKDLHSLPAVLNKILRLQEVGARVREGFDDDGFRKRSSQSILYSCLAKSDLDKLINDLQSSEKG